MPTTSVKAVTTIAIITAAASLKNRKDYDAYREAVNRNMLRDKEARRYADYREDRRNHAKKRDNRNVRQVAVKRDQREWNNRRNNHRAEFRGNGNGHRKHHHR
jgi:hypothetical protein